MEQMIDIEKARNRAAMIKTGVIGFFGSTGGLLTSVKAVTLFCQLVSAGTAAFVGVLTAVMMFQNWRERRRRKQREGNPFKPKDLPEGDDLP